MKPASSACVLSDEARREKRERRSVFPYVNVAFIERGGAP